MTTGITFFTPVQYLDRDPTFFSALGNIGDNYFTYFDINRAYVVETKDNVCKTQMVPTKANIWATALKIVTLVAPVFFVYAAIIPVTMLAAKIAHRWNVKFSVLNPEESDKRDPVEVLTPIRRVPYFNREVLRLKYAEIFNKVGLDFNEANAMQKHVAFFTDDNVKLTQQSIQAGLRRLNFGKITSLAMSHLIFKGVASAVGAKDGSIELKEITKAKHPSDTGIFSETGDVNKERLDNLYRFAKTSKFLLTSREFAQLRGNNWKRDFHRHGSFIGALSSLGEFSTLESTLADRVVVYDDGSSEPAITFAQLHRFYEEGPLLFEEIAARYKPRV